jgi:two-component system NtrC family response regulator
VVTPVGGRPTPVDARVVAATHRDLPGLTAQGGFREDLYHRLNVVPVVLPPLRDRQVDILPLAEHFLRSAAGESGPKRLTDAAATHLLRHPWPGNVRELRNAIERASILVRADVIDADDLDLAPTGTEQTSDPPGGDLPAAVARLEEAMIRRTLASCRGNRAEAARRLNIHRQLLYTKMQRYGLIDTDPSAIPTSGVGKPDT